MAVPPVPSTNARVDAVRVGIRSGGYRHEVMAEAPDPASLEQAIRQYLISSPLPDRDGGGELYVKVDLAPSSPDADEFTAGLFLSTPWPVDDASWLTKLMAHVRDSFERGVIDVPFRVVVGGDRPFETFRDEEVGKVLLNLLAYLTIRPH